MSPNHKTIVKQSGMQYQLTRLCDICFHNIASISFPSKHKTILCPEQLCLFQQVIPWQLHDAYAYVCLFVVTEPHQVINKSIIFL